MSSPSESQPVPGPDLAPVLVALLRREGMVLLTQRARLNGLLRDYAPNAIRDIRLLLTAHDAGTPARLGEAADPLETGALAREAERLVDEFGCARPLALNAVSTWGRALSGLRAPAPQRSPAQPLFGALPVQPPTTPVTDDDRPGWFGRWGGIGIGILLVAIAVARWLGLM